MHGFKAVIDNKVLGFAPHVTVSTFNGGPISRADTLVEEIKSYPEVGKAQPVVAGQTMLQTPDDVTGTLLKGVDQQGDVTDIREYIHKGSYDLSTDSSGLPGMVLGADLAKALNADINSVLTAYTIQGLPSPLSSPEVTAIPALWHLSNRHWSSLMTSWHCAAASLCAKTVSDGFLSGICR
ncbi:MAG: hypothetical protein U5J63_00015 [Fodinibius sp.]|nr:hypothetical protein [Fodinibius sp.]